MVGIRNLLAALLIALKIWNHVDSHLKQQMPHLNY